MLFTLRRLSAIDGEAILPLADAKEQCRVRHDDEDGSIRAYRDAAIAQVEVRSGVIFAPSEFNWMMPRFATRIELPVRPVTDIGDVKYLDGGGIEQTYLGARFIAGTVVAASGETFPSAYGHVSITFTAGLASPSHAPDLIAAVRLLTAHLYRNREAVAADNVIPRELPFGVEALIQTNRRLAV